MAGVVCGGVACVLLAGIAQAGFACVSLAWDGIWSSSLCAGVVGAGADARAVVVVAVAADSGGGDGSRKKRSGDDGLSCEDQSSPEQSSVSGPREVPNMEWNHSPQ